MLKAKRYSSGVMTARDLARIRLNAQGRRLLALVVDDEVETAEILADALTLGGFHTSCAHNMAQAIGLIDKIAFDVVVTDLRMPDGDGRDVIAHARRSPLGPEVVVITGQAEVDIAVGCMRMGAIDYILKPFDLDAVTNTATRAAEKHSLQAESQHLREVLRRSKQALMVALEARDCYTFGHCVSVAHVAFQFGEHVGASQAVLDAIEGVGELHDLGKIGIADGILNKAGPLTEAEYESMKFHPVIGLGIIDPLGTFPDEGALVASHHERWDGSGYPDGMAGEDIPIVARLTAVVDVFDACTTDRPYRPAMTLADGLEVIRRGSGKAFDPELADEFLGFFASQFENREEEYTRLVAQLRQV